MDPLRAEAAARRAIRASGRLSPVVLTPGGSRRPGVRAGGCWIHVLWVERVGCAETPFSMVRCLVCLKLLWVNCLWHVQ